jgi:hypothetical protein
MMVWDWREEKKLFHALVLKFKINNLAFCQDGVTIVAATTAGMKIWKTNLDAPNNFVAPGEDHMGSAEERVGPLFGFACFSLHLFSFIHLFLYGISNLVFHTTIILPAMVCRWRDL